MVELRHLRYFVAVAEELNFRRAAQRVHIDQTPLARTIRDLEHLIGVQLFVRIRGKLSLTPAGLHLLHETHTVLAYVERLLQNVRETDARCQSPLRIGATDSIVQPNLAKCMARWRGIAPDVSLELLEMHESALVTALQQEDIDVGFSYGLADFPGIVQLKAWSYPLMAMLPVGHALASQDGLNMAGLLTFPMVFCHAESQSGLVQQIQSIVRRYTVSPTWASEAKTLTGCVTRIAAGMGVGLGDAGHASTLGRPDIVWTPLEEDERVTTFISFKHQRTEQRAALQRFIAHAISVR